MILGDSIAGTLKSVRGEIYNAEIIASESPGVLISSWDINGIETDVKTVVIQNGKISGETEDEKAIIYNRISAPALLDLMPVLKSENVTGTLWIDSIYKGSRLKLSWASAGSDVESYKIYWDAGNHLGAFVLLDTVPGNILYWESESLVQDTYRFKISAVDDIGNESSYSNIITFTPDNLPFPVTELAQSYNQSNKSVSLAWVDSVSVLDADFAGYAIFWNYINGYEFTDLVNYFKQIRITTDNSISISIPDYGHWIFGVCTIDRHGNLSEPMEVTLDIKSDWTEGVAKATEPTDVSIEAAAGGIAVITYTSTFSVRIYHSADNETYTLLDTATESPYTTALLTSDRETHYFKLQAINSESEEDGNTTIYDVLLDGESPTTPVITSEVVA